MGAYVNPPDMTKEDWLKKNAIHYLGDLEAAIAACKDDQLVVILVDNGAFTAAAICFDKEEITEFNREDDHRHRSFFLANKEDLYKVSNLETYLPQKKD